MVETRHYTRAVQPSTEPPLRSDRGALEAVQRVTDAALAYLSEQELLDELLLRITEILHTDTAAILLLDESGTLLRARAARGIEEEVEQGVEIPVGKGFAGRIMAERAAVVIDDVDHADILNPILREKGIRSLLGVPLLLSGRPLGVLHVGSLVPRRFSGDDRDLLQLAADRAALAIEHARVYLEERRARATLESLQRITDAGLAYLPQDELLSEMLVRITEILSIDTAAVLLVDPSGEQLGVRAALGLEESLKRNMRIPVGAGFAGRVAAERRAVIIDDVARAEWSIPYCARRASSRCWACRCSSKAACSACSTSARSPLGASRPTSATCCSSRPTVPRSRSRARCCSSSGAWPRRCSTSSCPRTSEPHPGSRWPAATCRPSGASLGGDWYDSFGLTKGRIVVVVGDVVGHGLGAAAAMAQLRTAVRAYAADGHEPAAVAERVNRLMWELGPTSMTTLAYVVLDPEQETLQLGQRRPPAAADDRPGRSRLVPPAAGRPAARHQRDRAPLLHDCTTSRPDPRSCSTRTASSSAAASRSTSASSDCGRRPRARRRSTICARA